MMISLVLYALLLQPPIPKEAKPGKYGPPVQAIEKPAPKQVAPASAACVNGSCGSVSVGVNQPTVTSERGRFHVRRGFFRRGRCGAGGCG